MTKLELINLLIEELSLQKTRLRPVKGYGAGHPWIEKQTPKQVLGTSMYPDEEEEVHIEKPKKSKSKQGF